MTKAMLAAAAIALVLSNANPGATSIQQRGTFVGTTPCVGAVRGFVGGIAAGAPCHALKWELTLGTAAVANRWMLTAVYGVPPASNPNQMVDGPSVTKQGTFTTSTMQRFGAESRIFRLRDDAGASIAFAEVGSDLVNLANDDGSLVPGTSAWSYMLTRADRLEPPVVAIPRGPEGSYTVPPKESGPHVFAIFGGRSPCAGLARELKLDNAAGCARLKWRVTLLKDPRTNQPTIYKAGSSYTREREWTGAWRIVRGAPGFPEATVYQLDGDAEHGPILLLRVDDLVLFLDQQRRPLPGNRAFTYTLTKSD